MTQPKVWSVEDVVTLLMSSDLAVERALVALYNRQTEDEKRDSDTRHDNQRGFSAAHAKTGSWYARMVMGGWQRDGHRGRVQLFPQKLAKARALVLRYRRQLAHEANCRAVNAAQTLG